MIGEQFRNLADVVQRAWLAEELGVEVNLDDGNLVGIDLLDDKNGVELKARLSGTDYRTNNHHFTLAEYQYQGFPQKYPELELYWAFMKYWIAKPVKELRKEDIKEDLFVRREVLVVPWDAVAELPVFSPKTGPYRYVNKADHKQFMQRPDLFVMETKKGPIHIVRSFLKD